MHYTFHCAIIGYGTTFPVNIDGTQSVGELKKRIKEAKKHALASIDPDRLMLHKANINISKSDIRKKVMQQIQQNWIKVDGEEMVSAFEVSDYWEKSKLPKRTIHILVKLPLVGRKRKGVNNINPMLVFRSPKRGTGHFNEDTLADYIIEHQANRIPEFIRTIQENLRAKRCISPEQEPAFQWLSKEKYGGNFEVADRDVDCSDNELVYYAFLTGSGSAPSTLTSDRARQRIGHEYFQVIAAYLCKRYPCKTEFKSEAQWPVAFVGQIGRELHSYQPESDYMFLLDSYPLMLIEISSNPNESDRFRMLLQGSLLVRIMNSIKSTQTGSFVIMAIYITDRFVAKRYLIYQPDRKESDIEYIVDEFHLDAPSHAFQFFFELHNLPSALPRDDELSEARTHLDFLQQQVDQEGLTGFMNTPSKTNFNSESTAQQVSSAGYELLPEETVEGWTPLKPLPPTVSRARRSTGEVVILKLVDQDEFAIHSFFSSLKAPQNHTIPILGIIPLGVEKLIVMPQEQVLSNVGDSVLRPTGNSLASQFLEGVRFLHEQNVAHLDLKLDNIVITATMQLKIIDFGVSVRVSNLESWIEGYRGTEGWAAPELENYPDAKYQPIRADLWSAGLVLRFFSRRVSGRFRFAALVEPLLRFNPRERPYLNEIPRGALMVKPKKPKRERSVDVLKKE